MWEGWEGGGSNQGLVCRWSPPTFTFVMPENLSHERGWALPRNHRSAGNHLDLVL